MSSESVLVILGYYNGSRYILEQVNSILSQSHVNIDIHISDDNSDFDFESLLSKIPNFYRSKISFSRNLTNKGFCRNFFDALTENDKCTDYYAFSDQDDIWYQGKISYALKALSNLSPEVPALYCARTETFDEACQTSLGLSPLFLKKPSFSNALVQSIAGGNTMVFNKAARELIVKSVKDCEVVSHDWWCYQIVSGAGGVVFFDSKPCLKYRQHGKNIVGANSSWGARLVRIRELFQGNYRVWNTTNLSALSKSKRLLTENNQKKLEGFISARDGSVFARIFLFFRKGVYRQTPFGNFGLLVALVFKKV